MKKMNCFFGFITIACFIFASTAFAKEKIVFSLNWTPQAQHVPYFAALGGKIYEAEGLDVEIQKGNGSSKTIQRVALGDATFGLASAINLVQAKSKGIDNVVMIGAVFSKSPQLMVSLKKNNYTSPKDVAGKKVATTAFAALKHMLPIFLQRNNVTEPAEIVLMDSGVIFQAVISGKADFGDNYLPNLPTWIKLAKEQNKELNVLKFEDFGVDHYDLMLLGNKDYMQKNPEATRKFLKATYAGYAFSKKNPEQAVDFYIKYNPFLSKDTTLLGLAPTFELLEDDYSKEHGMGHINPAKVKETIELIRAGYKIEMKIDENDLFTNEYLK
jgi:NitT/TauT family transport system substrate-binding protein